MSSDAPPFLGDVNIPKTSDFGSGVTSGHTSATNGTTGTTGTNLKDSFLNNASAAANTVSNHPYTQNTKDTVVNGPVGTAVKDQSAKTGADVSGLANKRTAPSEPAATGQPLTHYHSFFYSLLTWEHPRATAIAFAGTIGLIFAARYLKLLRFVFKTTYMVLGATAAAEVVGKLALGTGLTSSFRPRRYYTIPRETLEATLDDAEQFINFFVIESQRLLFAENPAATVAAFFASLISYFLIRFTPFWGLSLLATCVLYLAPLVYITNQELIDHHVKNASDIVSQQASQVRDLAGQHTSGATSALKQYTNDYTAKAQEMIGTTIGQSRQKIVKENDFPAAPQGEIKTEPTTAPEPVAAS